MPFDARHARRSTHAYPASRPHPDFDHQSETAVLLGAAAGSAGSATTLPPSAPYLVPRVAAATTTVGGLAASVGLSPRRLASKRPWMSARRRIL
jgi:hypothetical protein